MMEYVAVDSIEPDWHIWEQFSIAEAPMALNRDAIDGVQSVHVAVNHPDEINTLFDGAIVYAKGARLMVMLRKWLGDEAFQQVLVCILKHISMAILSVQTYGMLYQQHQVVMSLHL